MKYQTIIFALVALVAPMTVFTKSIDYEEVEKVEKASDNCFASSLGFSCCSKGIEVTYSDGGGDWGIENGEWCGIGGEKQDELCGTFACCKNCEVIYKDSEGNWGIENGKWCFIKEEKCSE